MSFSNFLVVVKDLQKREWKVQKEFVYYSAEKQQRIVVKPGYETNFSSIPKLLWKLIGLPGEICAEASVIYDYICTNLTFRFTKREADEIFREAMGELEVGYIRRNLMYAAVRIGGRGNW